MSDMSVSNVGRTSAIDGADDAGRAGGTAKMLQAMVELMQMFLQQMVSQEETPSAEGARGGPARSGKADGTDKAENDEQPKAIELMQMILQVMMMMMQQSMRQSAISSYDS